MSKRSHRTYTRGNQRAEASPGFHEPTALTGGCAARKMILRFTGKRIRTPTRNSVKGNRRLAEYAKGGRSTREKEHRSRKRSPNRPGVEPSHRATAGESVPGRAPKPRSQNHTTMTNDARKILVIDVVAHDRELSEKSDPLKQLGGGTRWSGKPGDGDIAPPTSQHRDSLSQLRKVAPKWEQRLSI